MDDIRFFLSTEILFGNGKIETLGSICKAKGLKRVGIVTDKGVVHAGIIEQVRATLKGNHIDLVLYDEVKPNPTVQNVEAGKKLFLEEKCDGVIGIGGGSALDAAKTVSVYAGQSCDIKDLPESVLDNKLFCIAVPTTSGTSAEITDVAVLSHPEKREKFGIRHARIAPDTAVLDPLLTVSLPRVPTRDSGVDALCHAIESILSSKSWDATECLCLRAIELIGKNLRSAVFNPDNVVSREAMMKAELLAGMGFHHTYLCLPHAIGTPIGGFYDMPHGASNAIVFPETLKFLMPACLPELARIYRALTGDGSAIPDRRAAEMAIEEIERLLEDVQMPKKLSGYGARIEDMEQLSETIEKSYLVPLSPRVAAREEIFEICKRCI